MLSQVHDEPENSDSFWKSGYDRKVSAREAKKKKVIFWGIEVPETLSWRGWELGKEMIKHLTLKNVHGKAQKLSYRAPSTPFFFTVFPQLITLNPGMSVTLPIVFRPSEKRDYEDNIIFVKAEGEFSVTLHATLPRFRLSIPAAVQLPVCAIHSATEATFPVCNIGDLVSIFAWETSSPFSMDPMCGTLNPGAECMVKVVFKPEVAGVHYAAATCWFGGEVKQKRTIKLKALAKYPCLCVSVTGKKSEGVQPGKFQDALCFGSVAVGTTVEKSVEIFNMSVVDAPCRIERAKDPLLHDYVFSCDVSHDVVPAKGKLVLSIRFQPQVVGEHSTDYFTITSAAGHLETVLKVVGSCKGPSVSLHQQSVDFNWINLGESLMRTLQISNTSDVPAYYQFDIDCKGSVFSLDRPCGVLEGATTLTLKVIFRPAHPMNYHRRVVCLVHHQEPLYVDFFGTCHSDTAKPTTLQKRHLSWYRTNMVRGLTFYPPNILSEMLKNGKLQMDEKGALMLPPEISEDQPPKEYLEPNSMAEYFYDGVSSDLALFPAHVSVSPREYDFGCCMPPHKAESLSLCVTNHTKGNIIVAWTPSHGSAFQVDPEICDIPPLESSTFYVFCRPTQVNSLYAAELEGFAVYKVMRHYTNIENDATICPSWCLTVRLRAHTYEAKREHIIPQYILDVPKQTFPPVVCDTDTYCSMLLSNPSTSLITFSVNQTACPSVLVKPSLGYVIPGGHQIFFLSTHPVNTVLQQHVLPLELNSYPAYTKEIVLQSCGQSLLLLLEGDGILYFKPLHIGTSSTRMYSIKNCTRLPMVFTWKIHRSDSKILSVSPTEGILQPYETMSQAWTFTPDKETKYMLQAMVFVRWKSPDPLSPKDVHYVLWVIGEGTLGTIRAQKEHLDLGNVLVGDQKSCSIVLLNDEICTLNYILSVEQITGPQDPEDICSHPLALELEHSRGTIPARSKALVRIKVRPTHRLHYTWLIKYAICTPRAADLASTKEFLCSIVAIGVYPTLRITDACTTRTASSNRMHIWKLFSLDTLNEFLERDPTPGELTYKVPTRHSTCLIPPVYTPLLVDFDFGSAPVGSEPTTVMLLLENKGVVPVDWAFLFPSDQKIDMEHWAEDADFTPQELHQMRIQDNQLFSVSPKSGTLLPGQEKSVQLSHRHYFIGTDRLPVLLKISYGHEILLSFSGVTVERDQRYVHFASTKHVFAPIALGRSQPPTQIYKLYNGGSMPVTFEVQLDNIVKIREKNFQHPVFVCLTPRGEIPPGEAGHIKWIFSPLEAKTYTVDVLIDILEGDSTQITFQGAGYNPNIVEEAATSRHFFSSAVIPGSAKLTLPGQAATLSHHRICFGNIPDCTKAGRLVFLNNISKSKAVVFTWQVNSCKEMVLEVAPESGVAQPGESIPCFITLQHTRTPYFCRINLVCEVYIQESLVQYERDLHEWEKEKERQAVEFTITEKNLGTKRKLTSPSVRLSDSAETANLPESSAVIRKYKTLPPIKSHPTPSQPPGHIERGLLDKDASQVKPEPPTPLFLYLDVSARSYAIEDFLSNFALDFPRYFLSRPFSTQPSESKLVDGNRHRSRTDMEHKQLSLAAASKHELEVVTDILTGVIRSLLEDGRFQKSVRKIQDEPIPYFSQFQSAKSAELQDSRQGSMIPSRVSSLTDLDLEKDGEKKKISQKTSPSDLLESCETFHHKQLREKEIISRQPAVGNLVELVLENTLQNILIEASRGEVVLTAQPRVIALPPNASRRITNPATPPSRA
ncbi:cilia- and flagella-associated protein 65 isoform X5 [Vidua chalybeata]|nr:cilia- and flagella-associated protein 65 isoform X5 [Vidua chalybeata]